MGAAMRHLDDLHVVNACSLLLIAVIALFPDAPLRIVLGLPFVLFFPGYTLLAALYPRRDDLDGVERLALSLGLSLAVVPLIGLALNFLPWGIRLTPILVSLAAFVAICSVAAARSRGRLPTEERFSIPVAPILAHVRGTSWSHVLVALSAVALVGVIAWRIGAGPATGETFTEFYVLGPGGKAEDYPDRVFAGEAAEVILGVVNHERQQVTYRIAIRAAGEIIEQLGPIVLDHGQKWERSTIFRPRKPGDREKVEFLLYREGDVEPYRRLHLWMRVLPP
jgi:uncharacterized membrane protein